MVRSFEYWRKIYESKNLGTVVYTRIIARTSNLDKFSVSAFNGIMPLRDIAYDSLAEVFKKYFPDLKYKSEYSYSNDKRAIYTIELPEYFSEDSESNEIVIDFSKLSQKIQSLNILKYLSEYYESKISAIQSKKTGWEFVFKPEWNSISEPEVLARLIDKIKSDYLEKFDVDPTQFESMIEDLSMSTALGGSFTSDSELNSIAIKILQYAYITAAADEFKKSFRVQRTSYNLENLEKELKSKSDQLVANASTDLSESTKKEIIEFISKLISDFRPKGGKIGELAESILISMINRLEDQPGLIDELLQFLG